MGSRRLEFGGLGSGGVKVWGLESENLRLGQLWLGGGVRKVGVAGWSQGVGVGGVGIRGLESGKLGSGGLGSAELWLEGRVRASGEVGSRRLELGGGWGRGS